MLRITITAIFFERSITEVVEESLELQRSCKIEKKAEHI